MEFKEIYGGYKVSKCGIVLGKRGVAMSPSDNGRGYLIVTLLVNKKAMTKAVHRLVAEAWIPNPNNLSDVSHIDCCKTNNHVTNLEWMSHGQNIGYSLKTARRSAKGENNARCLTTETEVKEICEHLQNGKPCSAIRDMGYSYSLVAAIKRRKNWKEISKNYVW